MNDRMGMYSMKLKSKFCALLLVSFLIMVGCAGRDPNVIPVRSSFL